MTRDEVLALAKKADLWMTSDERIAAVERFAALVVAHEREECAKVCEERKTSPAVWLIDKSYNQAVEDCAAAIRSRD